ncbi:hypothetical protein Bhyg_07863 [Pseudolycoriella hygida]|uniref:PHD-type domain-containing protein n=1 Tax=Pseudolycoriella hygida TaxID=35572 RepID=A0A9Q0N3H6_9DIPT|nr:hypothetical protein Bhyg_07863 [Pseudolycoriella hygida]
MSNLKHYDILRCVIFTTNDSDTQNFYIETAKLQGIMASKRFTIYETYSCQFCDELDTDEMVQCDSCDLWFHFACLIWACYIVNIADVNLSTFSDWIYALATVASEVITDLPNEEKALKTDDSKADNYVYSVSTQKILQITSTASATSTNQKKCPACSRDFCKKLASCEKYKKFSRQEKWKLIKVNNLCGCCLGNHRYFNCKQKIQCGVAGCSFFHHVSLHNDHTFRIRPHEKQIPVRCTTIRLNSRGLIRAPYYQDHCNPYRQDT